jgi:hypothetical protein
MKSLAEFEYDIDNCSLWFSLVLNRALEGAPPDLVIVHGCQTLTHACMVTGIYDNHSAVVGRD